MFQQLKNVLIQLDSKIDTFLAGVPYHENEWPPLTPLEQWLDKYTWKGPAPWQDE